MASFSFEDKIRKQAEEARIRHAEVLGFFAALLTLVVTTIQGLTKGGDPKPSDAAPPGLRPAEMLLDAAQLTRPADAFAVPGTVAAATGLLMLAGVFMVAFGGLGWLLRGGTLEVTLRSLTVVFLGAFVFALGLLAMAVLSGGSTQGLMVAATLGLVVSAPFGRIFAALDRYFVPKDQPGTPAGGRR